MQGPGSAGRGIRGLSPCSAHREWGRRDATGVLIGVCLHEQGMREGGNEQERMDEGQR